MPIERAADLLQSSKYTIALTGAGISTPSGIPDFRSGKNGLWYKHNPIKVASLSTFRTRPEDFFSWFRSLAELIFNAEPNPAHSSLAELENFGLVNTIITQNIDSLHQKAGSTSILEVHGTLFTLTCVQCYEKYPSKNFEHSYIIEGIMPTCPSCKGILKPDVILFQEQLPRSVWQEVDKEIPKCDLMFVIGSSLEVNPVAQLPFKVLAQGGKLIILNEQETYLDQRADLVINQDAAKILPLIVEKLTDV